MPSNDIYLAFLSADITRSYFSTMGQLLRGMLTVDAWIGKRETGKRKTGKANDIQSST